MKHNKRGCKLAGRSFHPLPPGGIVLPIAGTEPTASKSFSYCIRLPSSHQVPARHSSFQRRYTKGPPQVGSETRPLSRLFLNLPKIPVDSATLTPYNPADSKGGLTGAFSITLPAL